MKIIDRYILKEFLTPFLLSVAIILFLLLTQQMLRMVELLIDKGVGVVIVIELFIYLVPSFLVLTLPIATLIASISAFNRLSGDYEIVAFRAAGIGMGRILRPVAMISAILCLGVYYLSVVAMPWSGHSLKDLAVKLLKKQVSVGIDAGSFNELIPQMVFYVDEMPTFNEMKGIFIQDLRKPEHPNLIIAKTGTIASNPEEETLQLELHDGSIHRRGQNENQYQRILFSSYRIKFNLSDLLAQPGGLGQEELSREEIERQLERAGGDDPRWKRRLQAYYRNYALPLASFFFGIIGVPIGIRSRRAGRLGGFAIGVFTVGLYYLLMISGDFLMASRLFTPLMAAWFPNIVLGLFTLWFVLFMLKEGRGRFRFWGY